MEEWSDFFARSGSSSDLFLLMTVSLSDPCYTVLLNSLIAKSGCSPLWYVFCKKHRCWKKIGVRGMGQAREPWKHSDSHLLGARRLMLAM